MAVASLGMRGSGSFTSVERPKNWRQQILLQFPNGDAPLTAILSKLREQPTDDPEFSWFEKGLPVQRGMIIGASLTVNVAPANGTSTGARGNAPGADVALTIAPDGGSASVSDVSIFKPGHVLYNQVGDEVYLVKKVDRVNNFIIVQTSVGMATGTALTAITGSTTVGDTAVIIGSGFPEGAAIGTAIAYQPAKYRNFTQIFRTPLWVTRTARKTRLRWDATGPYYEAKREALQIHALEMERGFFFGERSENTSISNPDAPLDITGAGTPLRTTRGIMRWLPAITSGATPTIHYDVNAANGGALTEAIFDGWCEEFFRFGSKEKVGFCGSTILNVLTQLAKNKSTIEVVPTDQVYGMHMVRYLTPFGSLMLVNHPLLSHDPVFRKDLFGIDVDKLTYRYITDTTFLENRQNPGDDASKDEFLTEAGLEAHFTGAATDSDSPNSIATPAAHGRLKGVATYGG